MSGLPEIIETGAGCEFTVRVVPRARANRIEAAADGAMRVSVTAPPEDGRANRELVKFLAGLIGVGGSSVSIVSGGRSRRKRVRVEGASRAGLETSLRKALAGQPRKGGRL
ncbi:MAG: DUF167 domain-containing protein [bacterium]